MTHKNTSY